MIFHFDGIEAASRVFLTLVLEAKTTDADFEFGPLDLGKVLQNGLSVTGATDSLVDRLSAMPGVLLEES